MDNPANDSSANMREIDRRRSRRYHISGFVWFWWQERDGQLRNGLGLTCNIGETGVFIESESLPPVATDINLVVALPTQWTEGMTLFLSGVGSVCHVRQGLSNASGFGASTIFRTQGAE